MKCLILSAFLFTVACAFAQPVINSNVITPLGTKSVYLIAANTVAFNFSPGGYGDSVIWDFTALDTTSGITYTQHTVRADTSFYYADYTPVVNRAVGIYEPPGPAYAYTYVDSTKFEFYGSADFGQSSSFIDPHKLLTFPFTYADHFTDTFYDWYNTIHGKLEVKADAYGTLMLPGIIYTNVLRVRVHDFYRYDIPNNPNDSLFYEGLYYRWYQPNTPNILLEYSKVKKVVFKNGQRVEPDSTMGLYITQNPMATFIEEPASFGLNVYPNPAGNSLMMNAEVDIESAELIDLCGKTIWRQNFFDKNAMLNLESIAAGAYCLRLTVAGNRHKTVKIIHH
ncbi:MAG TPA: T9SS type A sorting domain-containing protein [Chitinophagales bacterium]|nr:T9SS type A sorting domain-containing protein [Chitinophagales bacterium]